MAKNAIERDRSPIDQQWIQNICDQLLAATHQMSPGKMQDAILRRVEIMMDLMEMWQKRNEDSRRV